MNENSEQERDSMSGLIAGLMIAFLIVGMVMYYTRHVDRANPKKAELSAQRQ